MGRGDTGDGGTHSRPNRLCRSGAVCGPRRAQPAGVGAAVLDWGAQLRATAAAASSPFNNRSISGPVCPFGYRRLPHYRPARPSVIRSPSPPQHYLCMASQGSDRGKPRRRRRRTCAENPSCRSVFPAAIRFNPGGVRALYLALPTASRYRLAGTSAPLPRRLHPCSFATCRSLSRVPWHQGHGDWSARR